MAVLMPRSSSRDRIDDEELRVGLVLNGGSSLAIWMGGVCTEVDRLRRGDGAYGEILDRLETTARVDVIAGTSAGGLNGGLLAAAIALGAPLVGLQELWVKRGNLDDLLRSPFQRNPPSLMRGDEYFLPKLLEGFEAVAKGRDNLAPDHVHLTMVTSVLTGTASGLADDFGGVIPDVTHVGEITFVRDDKGTDDFSPTGALRQLALAARSSASFPFVFEPSYCPIVDHDPALERPSLKGLADFDASRYTVDGGALINKPFPPALEAIYDQRAERQVRRVLAYVAPDPGTVTQAPPDPIDKVPGIAKAVLDSVMTMPRTESVGRELEEIRKHNDCVANVRRVRDHLLRSDDLPGVAKAFWGPYRQQRLQSSVDSVVRRIEAGQTGRRTRRGDWDRAALRAALERARGHVLVDEFPASGSGPPPWRWGIAPVESVSMTALGLLQRALALAPVDDRNLREELRAPLRAARKAIHEYRTVASTVRDLDDGYWESQDPPSDAGALGSWAVQTFADWAGAVQAKAGDPRTTKPPEQALAEAARGIAAALQSTKPVLLRIAGVASGRTRAITDAGDVSILESGIEALLPHDGTSAEAVDECLRRLLAVEVALTVFSSVSPTCDQLVELMLISGNATNAFDGSKYDVVDKVAGVKAGHFGAFYKASWRANDWMFGRLDGAWRLAQVIVSPTRLRQLYPHRADDVFAMIEAIAVGGGQQAYLQEHRGEWNPEKARDELEFLDTGAEPPKVLVECARGVARRLQLEILIEELPKVLAAVRLDRELRGSSTSAAGFLAAYPPAEPDPLPAAVAVRVFKACDIANETFGEEAGTDLFTSTASRIAAVSVNAVGGTRLGLAGLNVLIGALKTFVLTFYVFGQAVVRRSRTGFAFMWIALTVGALALLLPAVSDVAVPTTVTLIAACLLISGFLMAWQRSGVPASVFFMLVLTAAAFAAPLVLIDRPDPGQDDAVYRLVRPVLAVAALVVLPALIGAAASWWSQRRPRRPRTPSR